MTAPDAPLRVGETALLPPEQGLVARCAGLVLSARMERLAAPQTPRRLRDPLIAPLMARAWTSQSFCAETPASALELVETLTASDMRAAHEPDRSTAFFDPRMTRAVEHIEAHAGEPLTVARLSAVACLSPSHFARLFKSATGETAWAFVQRRRCERAWDLLLASDMPIAEIAYHCGFASQAHFTNAFRRHWNTTPAKLRARG